MITGAYQVPKFWRIWYIYWKLTVENEPDGEM
jgi:hypothetical protein